MPGLTHNEQLKWFFPPLAGGEESGLNDAGIETFKKAERLAREITQNVLDNRNPVKAAAGEPAIVTFEYLDLPTQSFPGVKQFKQTLEACQDHVLRQFEHDQGTGNEKQFFESAMKLISHSTIPTLRAGDENTTGLSGSDQDRGGSYWRLIRGQGYSSLQGPGGGTYGIGQRAPFAHSGLRAILYSTRLSDGSLAFVGKSILASFPDPASGEMTQNKGWWCWHADRAPDWRTIRGPKDIPEMYRRQTVGTDLYVVGYTRSDWQKRVRWSILEHFFAAIETGQLCVRLKSNGSMLEQIDRENLEQKLIQACDEAKEELPADEYQSGLGATLYFLRALRDPINGAPFSKSISKVGEVKLFVYRDSAAPDCWCTMRRPRILVETHGSRILRGFAAVLICDSPSGNAYLASLEDPAHVRWHEDEARGWTETQKKEARQVRLEIRRFIVDQLRALRQEDQPDEQDVPDLGKYLPVEDDPTNEQGAGAASKPTGEHSPEESGHTLTRNALIGIKQRIPRRTNPGPAVRREDAGGADTGKAGGRRRSKRKRGKGRRGGEGDATGLRPSHVRFRSFMTSLSTYEIVLEAAEDVNGDATIVAVGEDSDYPIEIQTARLTKDGSAIVADRNKLRRLHLTGGQPVSIEIRLGGELPLCLALGN